MTDPRPSEPTVAERKARRRMLNLGEAVAIGALILSALGLWNGWRGQGDDRPRPTTVVEQKMAVPLALRGRIENGGKAISISPVDPGHALDSLTLTIAGKPPIALGSDGRLAASALEPALDAGAKDKQIATVPVRIAARYIEAGKDRRGGGNYRLSYRWEGGGLFGGHSLKLVGFSRG
jgi:hypothetical protein